MVRDTSSMALISTDQNAKTDYENKVRMIKSQKEEINKVKTEIESLKNDLGDIKEMMKQLLAKG